MKKNFFYFIFLFPIYLSAQLSPVATDGKITINGYELVPIKKLNTTSVKNQNKSGTCWIYSANSFMESELLRVGKQEIDLSEMYIARAGYLDRADNYVRRQGAAAFGQGAENHDVFNLMQKYGAIPQEAYAGFPEGITMPEHNELEKVAKSYSDALVEISKNGKLSSQWRKGYEGMVNAYFGGEPPKTFTFQGKSYTPQTYFQSLGINPKDYIPLTSFTHHPFYEPFVLEVSDNWSNGLFYNVPIEELNQIASEAVQNGYSVLWASDVSEKSFSGKEGLAVWPAKAWNDMTDDEKGGVYKAPVEQVDMSQEIRQRGFDEMGTTDDHGMHITGLMKDQKGMKYYAVKNSWGTAANKITNGYIYVSEPYFKAKTMSIMVHKDGIPAAIRKKLKI
jgi:bleomycin hydrolase